MVMYHHFHMNERFLHVKEMMFDICEQANIINTLSDELEMMSD